MKDSKAKLSRVANTKSKRVSRDSDIKLESKPYGNDKVKKPYIGHNNIDWRTSDPVMTKLVANLPFGLAAGIAQTVNVNAEVGGTDVPATYRQPGIMTVVTKLTAGNRGSATDMYNSAANLAFRKIYSWIRHANSGSKNYEAADLGLYLLSLGQCLGLLGWLQRLLRVVNEYSATNRYTPRALVRAMGVDIVDLQDHQPELKFLIAWFGRAIGSLAFPDIPYFHACYEAYKYVVRDNDSPKEQFYLLTSGGFGVYNPTYSSSGGGVQYAGSVTWNDGSSNTLMTFATLSAYVRERMDVLLGDEDCGIISGDILKACTKSGSLFKPEAFGEDYEVFVKDVEILQQIHNCSVLDAPFDLSAYYQMSGSANTAPYIQPFLTSNGVFTNSNGWALTHKLIIDAFSSQPDEKEVVNCTVLQPVVKTQLNAPSTTYGFDNGSASFDLHLPVKCLLFDTIGTTITAHNLPQIKRYDVTLVNSYIDPEMTNFDWHPMKLYVHVDSGTGLPDNITVVGDIQNFRIFDYDVAVRIHENSMLSLLAFDEHNFY